jgi:CBS domain containing-hemolysin-like protein
MPEVITAHNASIFTMTRATRDSPLENFGIIITPNIWFIQFSFSLNLRRLDIRLRKQSTEPWDEKNLFYFLENIFLYFPHNYRSIYQHNS